VSVVFIEATGVGGVNICTAHVEAIRFDKLGENSSAAYTICMTSGREYRVRKEWGEAIMSALEFSK